MSDERTKYIKDNATKSVVLAIELIKELPNIVKYEDNLYTYNGKYYDLAPDEYFKCEFNSFVMKYGIISRWKSAVINEVITFIKTYSEIKKVEMNGNPNLLCLNNGVLDIETMQLLEHSKDFYFDTFINVDYEPENKNCPVFVNFLKEVFCNNKEQIGNAIRLGGYLLDYNTDNMKKCSKIFLFDGPGGAGKSTLLDTYSLMFSEKLISSLSFEELSSNSFETAQLLTSRVNISGEQKRGYIDAENIKLMAEGGRITVREIYGKPITMKCKTKFLGGCNGMPKFNDTSDGIYRRLVIFKFKNQYKNDYEYSRVTNPAALRIFKQDKQLFFKIEKEKSAIFNLFLEGLKVLKEDNFQFFEGEDFAETIEEFKNDNDAAREFLKEKYVVDRDSYVPVKEVFAEFRTWHHDNVGGGNFKFRSNEMGKRIKEVFNVDSNGQRHFKVGNEIEFLRTYPIKKIVYDDNTVRNALSDVSFAEAGGEANSKTQQSIGLFGDRDMGSEEEASIS